VFLVNESSFHPSILIDFEYLYDFGLVWPSALQRHGLEQELRAGKYYFTELGFGIFRVCFSGASQQVWF
jgi:hypothetical protein